MSADSFQPAAVPAQGFGAVAAPGHWFIFQGRQLLVQLNGRQANLPYGSQLPGIEAASHYHFGSWDNIPCYAASLVENGTIPPDLTPVGLRGLWGQLEETAFWVAGRANQLLNWEQNHQFCGRCAAPMQSKLAEWARECPACGYTIYPNPFPAIITLVQRDNQLLLARSHRYPSGRYSVLAGFVEMGESVEAAVRREVREETGIEVRDISYFGSQPWPFPNSLMLAFTCHYASGEIRLEESEIADAQWFTAGNLPDIPPSISIARQLINWFVAQQQPPPQD